MCSQIFYDIFMIKIPKCVDKYFNTYKYLSISKSKLAD